MSTDVPRDNYFCRIRGTFPGSDTGPSYCTPNTTQAADRFRLFKQFVNGAAKAMVVPHDVDATNANIDEATYRLIILVTQRLVDLLQRRQKAVPELADKLATANSDNFQLLADNLADVELLVEKISNSEFGLWVPPPKVKYRLQRGGLVVIFGVGLLFSVALLLIPKELTSWDSN